MTLHAGQQAALYYARKRNRNRVLVSDLSASAEGSFTFASNPASGHYIRLDGTTVMFGIQVNIGTTLAITLATLVAYLNASADANIAKATYAISGNKLIVTDKTPGDTSFTLGAG